MSRRSKAIALGLLADRVLGEPPDQFHPVAWFGSAMNRIEKAIWADERGPGVGYAAAGLALGLAYGRQLRSTAAAVAVSVAGRELQRVAKEIGEALEAGDLEAARSQLPSLVGRDPDGLDGEAIAAAVIESVAENTVDAVVAPVFWALVAGGPGATAYRAINTMDAMVGHRNGRYGRFGWAAARLDDAATYLPARLFAGLVAMQQPNRMAEITAQIRRDASAHPSPNAGVAETAVAAAIQRQLGGTLSYNCRVENRPTLGDGPRPTASDIPQAISISQRVEITLVAILVVLWLIDKVRSDQ